MSDKHLHTDDLIELLYGSSKAADLENEHLQACGACRTEYEKLTAAVDLCSGHRVPALHPYEKVEIFERAWMKHTARQKSPSLSHIGLQRLWNRPSLAFVMGIVAGIFFTVAFLHGAFDLATEVIAKEDELNAQSNGFSTTYSGMVVQNISQEIVPGIENARLYVQPGQGKPQRVIMGTVDDGGVLVVWNLP